MARLDSSQVFPDELSKSQDGLTRGVRISKGLDRLKVGFYVQFENLLLFDILADAKHRAQETKQVIPLQLGMEDDQFYNCHPRGKAGGYNFHISRADVSVFISTRKDYLKTPNVWLDIGSASCWSPGYAKVINQVYALLKNYSGKVIKNSVSEVHICADFIGLDISTLGIEDEHRWIKRANKFNAYSDSFRFTGISMDQTEGDLGFATETGISIGKGDIALRVYDKVFEIKRSNSKRSLFASVWESEEYDDQPVTRVEYQFRKLVLKQFQIRSLEQLFTNMNALWQYCTTEWSRYCEKPFDRQNRHQDRAIIHKWWQEVQNLDWGKKTIVTRRKPIPQKDMKQMIDQMVGCAMNAAAIHGCRPDDIDQICTFLMGEIDTYCQRKNKKINPKTGLTELQEKMKQKINEVWPYGYGEVYGPTAADVERGYITYC